MKIMKKINLIIFTLLIFPVAADDLINENKIKKLHPSYQEDAYVVTFQGSPNSFILKVFLAELEGNGMSKSIVCILTSRIFTI